MGARPDGRRGPMTATPPATGVIGRALGIGLATGGLLGLLLGTVLLPVIGTVIGACTGLALGAGFGLANGVALAVLTRRRTDRDGAALTGALVSGSLAAAVWWHSMPENRVVAAPIAVFFAGLGAVLAPRAVARSRRSPG